MLNLARVMSLCLPDLTSPPRSRITYIVLLVEDTIYYGATNFPVTISHVMYLETMKACVSYYIAEEFNVSTIGQKLDFLYMFIGQLFRNIAFGKTRDKIPDLATLFFDGRLRAEVDRTPDW